MTQTKQIGFVDIFLIFGGMVSKVLLILLVVIGMITMIDRIDTMQYGKLTIGLIVFWFILGGIYEYKKHCKKQV
jgi:hypothetical protein